MKQIFVFFIMVFISFNPVFPGNESYQPAETFMLHENAPIYLSIEHYKMKDGWTPVVLSVGGVDCLLRMDASGRVSEWWEKQDHTFAPLCFIDPLNQALGKGAGIIYSTPLWNTTLIPGQSRTWAMKQEEPGKQIIGGK